MFAGLFRQLNTYVACNAIRNGDCDAAVVVACTTQFHPAGAISRSLNGMVSPTGNCSPFSDSADGFVASEGAVAIVIQKSTDVKGYMYGTLRATAIAQDGHSHGFFAPNPLAQENLLKMALVKAKCSPDDISVLEGHLQCLIQNCHRSNVAS